LRPDRPVFEEGGEWWLRVTDPRGYGPGIDGWGPTYEVGRAWVRGWSGGIWLRINILYIYKYI
jgi:hypothetical protein